MSLYLFDSYDKRLCIWSTDKNIFNFKDWICRKICTDYLFKMSFFQHFFLNF